MSGLHIMVRRWKYEDERAVYNQTNVNFGRRKDAFIGERNFKSLRRLLIGVMGAASAFFAIFSDKAAAQITGCYDRTIFKCVDDYWESCEPCSVTAVHPINLGSLISIPGFAILPTGEGHLIQMDSSGRVFHRIFMPLDLGQAGRRSITDGVR